MYFSTKSDREFTWNNGPIVQICRRAEELHKGLVWANGENKACLKFYQNYIQEMYSFYEIEIPGCVADELSINTSVLNHNSTQFPMFKTLVNELNMISNVLEQN